MKWNHNSETGSGVYTLARMFSGINNIIEVDLSKFDSRNIASMEEMFKDCKQLKYVNFGSSSDSLFKTSFCDLMKYMFDGCESLISLDLSNFNTEKVYDMKYMFNGCKNLVSLDISNFKTEWVSDMSYMFQNCNSLTSLNLSSFNTSNVENMKYMFAFCESLTSLELLNFETDQVTNMIYMFRDCLTLKSLDLSSFETTNLNEIYYMFYNCMSLISLNIENIKPSNIGSLNGIFQNCASLQSIDLSNFDTTNSKYMNSLFEGCSSLVSLDLSQFDTSKLESMEKMFKDCTSLTSLDLSIFNIKQVFSMNKIFYNCNNLEFLNFGNTQEESSFSISNAFEGTPKNLVYCINNALSIKNALLEINNECSFNDCSNNWKENQINLDECTFDCKNSQYFRYKYENKCYSDCPEGTTSNEDFLCINIGEQSTDSQDDSNENDDTQKGDIINGDNIFESNNICHAKNFFQKECKINSEDLEERDNMIKRIINEIMDGSMNNLLLKVLRENKNLLIEDNNEIYEIKALSTSNKSSLSQNFSTPLIDFNECEKILKKEYNIENDEELILFMTEYYFPEYKIPLIEYEIFSSDGKTKFNLDYCSNISIPFYITVDIDENELFKYDPSSDYYKDICFRYTTDDETDITIFDRKNEFNNQNLSLCENNCTYKGYNFENKNVKCECQIKSEFKLSSDIRIESKTLLNNFIDIKKLSNIGVIKCYKLLFIDDGLIKNIGSYILLFIIFLTIIFSILFCIKGYKQLYNKINQIFKNKYLKNNINKYQYDALSQNDANNIKNNNKENIVENNDNNKNINLPPKKKIKVKKKRVKRKKNSTSIFNPNSNSNSILEIKNNSKENKQLQISSDKEKKDIMKNKINIDSDDEKIDYELNSLSYEDAIKYDTRTYLQYYMSLIRTKQLLIFTFYPINDYNSRIIKICLFLFSFSLYYIINALFFNDSSMHQIYVDKGAFNFIFQIPQILYSTIISAFIKKILSFLSLTEKNIIQIKSQKTFELGAEKMKKILKCLYIKFILFFIFNFLFLIMFWYYISCFCAVYKNTQIYLIKDTAISFGTSLLYPFGINIIPGFFRIPSLKAENKDKKCLYIISKILQLF